MYNSWTLTKAVGGNAGGCGGTGQKRIKGRKKWNNCNSIIIKKTTTINSV